MKKNEDSLRGVHDATSQEPKMKRNDESQKVAQFAICREQSLKTAETGVYAKVGKYMKLFIYLTLLTGIGIVFNSCMGGYVASEPSYVDYARPQRLNDNQIWIDGDWGWNSRSHVYVQRAGYWENPRQGQSYVSGKWQTTARGKSWIKGHWQKQTNRHDNRNR
jgi:hypothetical protein